MIIELLQFAKGVAGAFKQQLGIGRIERHHEAAIRRTCLPAQRHRDRILNRPAPRLQACEIIDSQQGDRSFRRRRQQRRTTVLHARRRIELDDDLPLDVDLVLPTRRSDKDHGRINCLGKGSARGNRDLVQPLHRMRRAAAHQLGLRQIGAQANLVERDGLEVTAFTRRLQSIAFKRSDHVARRAHVSFTAGVAAFHAVVGERFDIVPPALGLGRGLRCACSQRDEHDGRRSPEHPHDGQCSRRRLRHSRVFLGVGCLLPRQSCQVSAEAAARESGSVRESCEGSEGVGRRGANKEQSR